MCCYHYQLNEKSLLTRGRLNNVSSARQLAGFFAITLLSVRPGDVETQLKVSQPAVCKLARKGRALSQLNQMTLSSLANNS
jgi:hypothetical protein